MNRYRTRRSGSRSWLPLAAAALAGLGGLVTAAPPPAPAAAPGIQRPLKNIHEYEVRELVVQLTDPSWAVRQAAQDELVAFGPDILPLLEQARLATADLQTRSSIAVIESQISETLARAGRSISVRLENAEASAAVRELAQQAGIPVVIDERRLMGVRLQGAFDGESFWQTMLDLCARHDLDIRPIESGLRATRATEGAARTIGGPASTYGPMLILARGAHYERKLTLERDPAAQTTAVAPAPSYGQERFRYEFEALLEPRFLIGSRKFTVLLTQAADDAGNILHAAGAADGLDLGRDLADPRRPANAGEGLATSISEAQWSVGRLKFDVDLLFPDSPGRSISLAGRIRGLVGAELEDVRVAAVDMAEGQTWHAAGERTEVRLEPSAAAGRWVLTLVTGRAVAPEVSDLLANALATAELTDAVGDRFRRGSLNSSTGDDGRVTLRMEFIGPADETMLPRHLSVRVPRRALELDIPFEFENLPMP
jgi:hypothetical protein